MTKKKILSLSSFINLLVLALSAYTVWGIKAAFDAGAATTTTGSLLPLSPMVLLIIYSAVTVIALATVVLKVIASAIESDRLTSFVIIIEAICLVFFFVMGRNAIKGMIGGVFLGNLTEVGLVVSTLLAILVDLISFPSESWGRLTKF